LSSPCFGLAAPCSGYVASRGVSVPSSSFLVSAPCPAARLPLIFPWQTSAPSRVVPLHALAHSVHHHHALHSHSMPPNLHPKQLRMRPSLLFLVRRMISCPGRSDHGRSPDSYAYNLEVGILPQTPTLVTCACALCSSKLPALVFQCNEPGDMLIAIPSLPGRLTDGGNFHNRHRPLEMWDTDIVRRTARRYSRASIFISSEPSHTTAA